MVKYFFPVFVLVLLTSQCYVCAADDDDDSSDASSRQDSSDASSRQDSSDASSRQDSSDASSRQDSSDASSRQDSSDASSKNRDPTSDGADSSAQSYAHDCDGRGVAYCSRFAVTENECPPMCVNCDDDKRTDLTKRAKSKLYDYVYVYRSKVCLAHCHGRSVCSDWDEYKGIRHCKAIRCKDDRGIEGCHSYGDFTTPSCDDCKLIFPRACTGKPVSSDADDSNEWDDSSGWSGYRVYQKMPVPFKPDNSSYTNDTVTETFFNVSDWNTTSLGNSTLRFRVLP